jgi:hypothetical protein
VPRGQAFRADALSIRLPAARLAGAVHGFGSAHGGEGGLLAKQLIPDNQIKDFKAATNKLRSPSPRGAAWQH